MKRDITGIPNLFLIVSLLLIPSLYVALIAAHGYRFGDEDMTETLSYALFLRDNTLFPADFYIQSLAQQPLNERFPFALILSLFGSHLEWSCFLMHGAITLICLLGWYKLVKHFVKDPFLQILFFLISFFLLYGVNLGGNEVYYYYLVPGALAKSIAIWTLWALIKRKWNVFFLLLIAVTFIQPLVGIQLFLLGSISIIPIRHSNFLSSPRTWLPGILCFIFTAGVWIAILFFQDFIHDHQSDAIPYADLIESRLAHHFFPSYFDKQGYFILIPLFILGTVIWAKNDRLLFFFFILSLLGSLVYYISVEWLQINFLLKSQWFKTTIWLKPLSVLALIYFVDQKLQVRISVVFSLLMLASIVSLAFIQLDQGRFLKGRPYHFPTAEYKNPEMTLAERAREILPHDACLVTPPYITGFRFFSRRSLYIDYKSNLHSRAYLSEAYRRRKQIYNIDVQTRREGQNMALTGNMNYHQLKTHNFRALKGYGVTHCVVESSISLDLPLILQNELFKIYTL